MKAVDPGLQATLAAAGAQQLPLKDERYPPLLREIHDPPPLLYVRGDPAILSEPQLAIVGARRASAAALRITSELAGRATEAGLHITSGLALGIDGAAHRGALEAGGRSVAVMATGIESIYPLRHRGLGIELEEKGCLVTEFPPGTHPRPRNFPARNRIISGLSLGVLVIEAALPSGSLITASTALEQGREVFALPWSIVHVGGSGCLHLLRDGAKMVVTIDDVLEELAGRQGWVPCERQGDIAGTGGDVEDGDQDLLALVGFERVGLEELAAASGLAMPQLMAELSALEVKGLVSRDAGGYIRC